MYFLLQMRKKLEAARDETLKIFKGTWLLSGRYESFIGSAWPFMNADENLTPLKMAEAGWFFCG